MKRFLILTVLIIAPIVSFGFEGQDLCDKPVAHQEHYMVCVDAGYEIMGNGTKWESVKISPFALYDHLYLGYPDDSTNTIYSYVNKISKNGKHIGYSDVMAIHITEGEWTEQIIIFYDMKGNVVGAKAKPLW